MMRGIPAKATHAAYAERLVRFVAFLLVAGQLLVWIGPAKAVVLVTNVFFNSVDLYDDQTGQLIKQAFFAPTVNPSDVLFFSGVVVNPVSHEAFVSANFADSSGKTRVYRFDAATGAPLSSPSGGAPGVFLEWSGGEFNPAGLALDSTGNLYVANQGGMAVHKYDAAGELVGSFGDGGASILFPSGVTCGPGGDLFVSNFGSGKTVKVNTTSGAISPVASCGVNGPFAPNGILAGPGGEIYVADVFGNGVLKYGPDGLEITGPGGGPFINVSLPNIPAEAYHPNAPSGLAFDDNGDLLVAVLGPTNPFMPPYEVHGALLRYSAADGTLLQAIAYGVPPAGGLALVATTPTSRTWSGEGGNSHLANGANWLNGVPGAVDPLLFGPGPSQKNPTNGGDTPLTVVGGITFSETGYTFSGSTTLTVNGAITNNAAAAQIDVPLELVGSGLIDAGSDAGNTLTISGQVTGAVGLVKDGAGKVVLTQDAAYTGNTIVNAGILEMQALSNGDSTTVSGTLIASCIRQDSLTINAGGKVEIGDSGASMPACLPTANGSGGLDCRAAGVGSLNGASAVPEPGALALLAMTGLLSLLIWRPKSAKPAGLAPER